MNHNEVEQEVSLSKHLDSAASYTCVYRLYVQLHGAR